MNQTIENNLSPPMGYTAHTVAQTVAPSRHAVITGNNQAALRTVRLLLLETSHELARFFRSVARCAKICSKPQAIDNLERHIS